MKVNCGACKFFEILRMKENFEKEPKTGTCHYNPPVPVNYGNSSRSHFPIVHMEKTWCGAFEERKVN